MNALKTRHLLGLIAGAGVCGMLLMAFISFMQIDALNRIGLDGIEKSGLTTKALIHIETANVEFKRQVQEWKDTLLRGNDPEKFAKYFANFKKRETAVDQHLQEAAKLSSESDNQQIAEILTLHHELGEKYRQAIAHYDSANPDAAKIVDKLVAGMDRPLTDAITSFVGKIEKASREEAGQKMSDIRSGFQSALTYFALAFLLAAAAVLSIMFWGAGSILQRLGGEPLHAATIAQCISLGDLTVHVPSAGEKNLMGAMHDMKLNLSELARKLHAHVEKIGEHSRDMENSASALESDAQTNSTAAAEMAQTLEEIATSIEELSGNADEVLKISAQSGNEAEASGSLVREIVRDIASISSAAEEAASAMSELDRSSQKISHIAEVIQEIASQTNLLALNAAIEAARAGEQGRGFAVVADEVRNLAARTNDSTREIVEMIEKIHGDSSKTAQQMNAMIEHVKQGSIRAGSVGEAMNRIQDGIQRATDAVSEITSAIREQSAAANIISEKVEQVAMMSASNLATSTSLSSLAGQIRGVSDELKEEAHRFKLEKEPLMENG